MTNKPILFSAPMICALLDGSKTQTRRGLKIKGHKGFFKFGQSETSGYDWTFRRADHVWEDYRHNEFLALLPYQIGDRLWVREAHFAYGRWITTGELTKTGKPKRRFERDFARAALFDANSDFVWSCPEAKYGLYKRPGMFMHRVDSRLTMTVTDARVQRLKNIKDHDCIAEGIPAVGRCYGEPRDAFANLWNGINGPDAWESNPWVAAYTFITHKQNIDQRGV